MLVVEPFVEFSARVDDPAIDPRADGHGPGPIFGLERQFDRAQVHIGHRDQAPFRQRGALSLPLFETDGPVQHSAPEVEFLPV